MPQIVAITFATVISTFSVFVFIVSALLTYHHISCFVTSSTPASAPVTQIDPLPSSSLQVCCVTPKRRKLIVTQTALAASGSGASYCVTPLNKLPGR